MNLAITNLVIGIMLLLFGRELFWLFVGVAGFLIGIDLATRFFVGSDSTRLVIALAIGIVGAISAILFYKAAVAVAGFVVGGYLSLDLVRQLVAPARSFDWGPYVIGGILGAVMILLLLNWALIVLSSCSGASLIVHSMTPPPGNLLVVYALLVVMGILVQSGILFRSHRVDA
jgi:uncharacterized membrane protein